MAEVMPLAFEYLTEGSNEIDREIGSFAVENAFADMADELAIDVSFYEIMEANGLGAEPTMSNSGGRPRPGEGGPLPPPQTPKKPKPQS